MPRLNAAPFWQTALVVVSVTVTAATLVTVLYVAQVLFIPIVLAIFLTFLLAPVVSLLQRLKLGRKPSVVLVILLVAFMLGGAGWMLSVQVKNLIDELPWYTENINDKLRGFRAMGEGNTFGQLQEMATDIAEAWNLRRDSPHEPDGRPAPEPESVGELVAVVLEPSGPGWVSQVTARLGNVVAPLAHLALALVLAVFMLIRREALRNRLIHLVGDGSMTAATNAVDDASARISRYLRVQFLINGCFGILWGAGLYFIGLDYFVLWGFLGAALRYIPYLGASLAAFLPLMLSIAQFPGWWPTFMILSLLLVMEFTCNNIIEPWLYGQSIGVSEVAMLISSVFWALLWGPIGLILAAPLTVCLLVLGKYVPQLNFLVVLLGDQPALSSDVSFYQRLLAHDREEALRLAQDKLDASSLAGVFDEMIVPALVYAKRDHERDEIDGENEGELIRSIRAIVDELQEHPAPEEDAQPPGSLLDPAPGVALSILAYPARDEEDRLALELLRRLLDPARWNVNVVLPDAPLVDVLEDCGESRPALVCVGALPPGGLMNTRTLCTRLLTRCADLPVVVGRWGLNDGADASLEQLRSGGASAAASTLAETCRQLEEWRPELLERARARTGAATSTEAGDCNDNKT